MDYVRIAHANRPGWRMTTAILLGSLCVLGLSEAQAQETVKVVPPQVQLRGPDSVQQLAVELPGPTDVTHAAEYSSSDPKVVTVDPTGTIAARGDGDATITVRHGSVEARIPVHVQDFAPGPPVNFPNQVVPIFTKLGCNSGGCHGKASGQNGFRLSLLGFVPTLDYETLTKEGRGRRVFPAAPEESLLLTKATAKTPHGGGKKMEPGSHEYHVLTRWIATGMPYGKPDDPSVARIEIYPDTRVLPRGGVAASRRHGALYGTERPRT